MKWNTKHTILMVAMMLFGYILPSAAQETQIGESNDARVPRIIYHDQHGSIIQRVPFVAPYQFDEDAPIFFVELPYENIAWNTKADGTGTSYTKKSEPLTNLTGDLNLYPELKMGHFVRFDSQGGTPIEYQFVFSGEKASEPTAPTRAGYSFDKWYSDEACTTPYSFEAEVTADIMLYAKWTLATSSYKVNIWLENPSRGSGTATASDYIFYGYYTKSAATEAKNITYTVADLTTGTMEKSVAFVRKGDISSQIFFLDDQYGSQALTLTNASLAAVNAEGVKADGSTELNVYLRRAEYNFTLKDNSHLSWDGTYSAKIRYGEKIENWINRNNCGIPQEVLEILAKSYEVEPYRKQYSAYENTSSSTPLFISSDDGTILLYEIYTETWMNHISPTRQITEDYKFLVELIDYSRPYTFHINKYAETLESAKNGLEEKEPITSTQYYYLYEQKYFGRASNYSDGFTLNSLGNGFTIKKIRLIDKDGNTVTQALDNFRIKETSSTETKYVCPTDWYSCSNGFVTGNYPPHPYTLEGYYTRDHFNLNFETNTLSLKVDPVTVFYDDQLKLHADKIVDQNGNKFVVDETRNTDNQKVLWIFKGWYKNKDFSGSPVNFENTEEHMPASNLTLHAKWEPKTIIAEYDAAGGKVEGKDKIEKTQPSGRIPVRPADPTPPEGMFFSYWTINGKYYDFTDPIYEDTELVAVYYSKQNNLKVTYSVGRGSGTAPADTNKYLLNANPEILESSSSMIAPIGTYFIGWNSDGYNPEEHEGAPEYKPGDEFIIKQDTRLIAQYSTSIDLTIKKLGLNAGESATFSVVKTDDSTVRFNVLLTGTGSDPVTATITNLVPGEYTVTETDWSWAYNETPLAPITKTITVEDYTFEFTNMPKDSTPLHGEAMKGNSVVGYEDGGIVVDVKDWEKTESRKIRF